MKADRQTPIVATNVSEQNEAIRSLEVGERLNSVFIEIDRSRFDHADKIKARYSSKQGLSKEVVLPIVRFHVPPPISPSPFAIVTSS